MESTPLVRSRSSALVADSCSLSFDRKLQLCGCVKMRALGVLSAAAVLVAQAHAARWSVERALAVAAAPSYTNYTQTQLWFDSQRVDHFNAVDGRTWSQRYWISETFFTAPSAAKPTANVLLYLCGEYTCPGINPARLYPLELAQNAEALVVVLEHRFYGSSYPLPDLATDNLPLLSSRQALEDLVSFLAFIDSQLVSNYSLPAGTVSKKVVVGGSYPGALSAWLRIKYPHVVAGSLASSGVVNAYWAMPQFDEQVAAAAGPVCAAALRNVTAAIEASLPGIKAQFGASALSDEDFLFMVADAGAEGVQYGHRDVLCSAVAAWPAGDPLPGFVNYTNAFWGAVMGSSPADYDTNALMSPNAGDGRSWTWQWCTEFGWAQVAPANNSIRSAQVDSDYFSGVCSRVFGLPAGWQPDTDATNQYYGGATPAGR